MNKKFLQEGRQVIHLDMDAFYASVEVLDVPSLKGKPVIVGGDVKRGVVSAASYEARKFGVHSALPMAIARRRCPSAVILPPRMARYSEISKRIFNIFQTYTPLVEPISLDEAFLDVTGSIKLFGPAETIAARIKEQVADRIGLTVSAGVASSKLVAKIASDFEKPDGLTVVPHGQERSFLAPLPISRLWGVGKTTREALALLGVYTIGDLSRLPLELLEKKFGKHGPELYNHALGLDDREVIPDRETKSVGHEETFDVDLTDCGQLHRELFSLADKVARRLRKYELAGRTVTLKIRYGDFRTSTRSHTLTLPTNDNQLIFQQSLLLLGKTDAGKRAVRLLGISVSQLHSEAVTQMALFADGNNPVKRQQINQAVDDIQAKFGGRSIRPGRLLETS
jgi:DNA polymerase-4